MCGEVFLCDTAYPPNTAISVHEHESAFCCFVLHGSFEERTDREERLVAPLASLVRWDGERHANRFGAEPVRCLNVTMPASWLKEVGGALVPWLTGASPGTGAAVAGIRLYTAFHRAASGDTVEDAALDWISTLGTQPIQKGSPPRELVAVRDLLEAAELPIPVRELARVGQCHPVTLARRFRSCWGISPFEYGRRARLEKACEAVVRSKEPLSMIAARFGFCDQAHLTRAMSKRAGLPPGCLRTDLPPRTPLRKSKT